MLLACYSIKLNLNGLDVFTMKFEASLQSKGDAINLLHNARFYKPSNETFASQVMQRIDRFSGLESFA